MTFSKGSGSMPAKGGMSFILAQTILYQLSMLDGSLLSRINHISLIHGEIKAIVDAEDKCKLSKDDTLRLEEVEHNIEALRDNYEPIMDDDEAKQVSDTKRKTSEKLIDLSRYNLLYITEKYKLVDVRALQEIQGLTWGE
ncbi:MAG TPA: hypothetical protein VGK06_15325 [Methanosarcina sp.]|jgi:hypothetical protein